MFGDETVTVTKRDGSTFETLLTWQALQRKATVVDQGDDTVYILLDQVAGAWREMTDDERAREQRAWDGGPRDMQ